MLTQHIKNTTLISLILIAGFTQNFAQQNPYAFKVYHPEFLKVNSKFEISLVASDNLLQYDDMSLLIFSEDNVELLQCTIRNFDSELKLKFSGSGDDLNSETYRIDIPRKFFKYDDRVFQINLTFLPEDITETEISFGLETVKRVVELENIMEEENETWEIELPSVSLNFYDARKTTGKAVLLEENSQIEFQFYEESYIDNLLISFWARTNTKINSFFDLLNQASQDTVFSISKTKFGTVKIPENLSDNNFSECFISDNSYNHYSVLLSSMDHTAKLYINKKLIYSTFYIMNYPLNQLTLKLNSDSSGFIEIDELRVIALSDNIQEVFKNIHYNTYSLDSSRVLYSQNFNAKKLADLKSTEYVKMNLGKVKLVKSGVPIYSRTPQLKVVSNESHYELSWTNLDDVNVSKYYIEKSLDGKIYKPISSRLSANDPLNEYFSVDSRDELDEVVYYRIRQLNKDGSTNYSSGIKLGSAKIDYFNVEQNYPNPFNPSTSVSVEVFFESEFEITVYDLTGTKIEVIFQGPLTQGLHTFPFDGSNLTSGVYIFEVSSPFNNRAIKMILAK